MVREELASNGSVRGIGRSNKRRSASGKRWPEIDWVPGVFGLACLQCGRRRDGLEWIIVVFKLVKVEQVLVERGMFLDRFGVEVPNLELPAAVLESKICCRHFGLWFVSLLTVERWKGKWNRPERVEESWWKEGEQDEDDETEGKRFEVRGPAEDSFSGTNCAATVAVAEPGGKMAMRSLYRLLLLSMTACLDETIQRAQQASISCRPEPQRAFAGIACSMMGLLDPQKPSRAGPQPDWEPMFIHSHSSV